MYLVKTPSIVKNLFSDHVWDIPTDEQCVYLTFDDGPIPEVTPWVLDLLEEYGFKGTFFCVGDNILKHPQVFQKIISDGHAIGNHTHTHLKGWNNSMEKYLADFNACGNAIKQYLNYDSNIFRPPYGRITPAQSAAILNSHRIIMWSVLSKDYNESYDEKLCLKNTLVATKSGSIVLFHDSLKARKNLYFVLPQFLKHFSDLGYSFKAL